MAKYNAAEVETKWQQYWAEHKTFKTVPGSGGVSAAANQIEGRYALSWADNIWHDMLGGA